MIGYFFRTLTGGLRKTLRRHFGGILVGQIITAAREFPMIPRRWRTRIDHLAVVKETARIQ